MFDRKRRKLGVRDQIAAEIQLVERLLSMRAVRFDA
jgi:hypothetical protein